MKPEHRDRKAPVEMWEVQQGSSGAGDMTHQEDLGGRGLNTGGPTEAPSAALDTPAAHGGSASSAEPQARREGSLNKWNRKLLPCGQSQGLEWDSDILILTFKGPSVSDA